MYELLGLLGLSYYAPLSRLCASWVILRDIYVHTSLNGLLILVQKMGSSSRSSSSSSSNGSGSGIKRFGSSISGRSEIARTDRVE